MTQVVHVARQRSSRFGLSLVGRLSVLTEIVPHTLKVKAQLVYGLEPEQLSECLPLLTLGLVYERSQGSPSQEERLPPG